MGRVSPGTRQPARRRVRATVLMLAVTAAIAGCGNSLTPVPSVFRAARPLGFHAFALPRYGFGLLVPKNWNDLQSQVRPPVVMIVASGPAVVAMSNYARTLPAPVGSSELQQAQSALLAAIRARQPGFRVLGFETLKVAGQPAVQISGIERINGRRRRVRSLHIFLSASELVLEEYAPVSAWAAVDREVFSRVSHSLELLPGKAA